MAERAWVVRARRTGMRRYTARGASMSWLLCVPQRILGQRAWPRWFRWFISPFSRLVGDRRSQQVDQAARAARAAFEDVPQVGFVAQARDVGVLKDTLASRLAYLKWGGLARLPLR